MPFAPMFGKAAILLIYLQVFGVVKRMRIAVWVGLIFDFLIYGVSLILVPYFEAPHIGETWDGLLVNRRPWLVTPTGPEQGTCALVLDLYIFILPIPMLSHLQVPSRKRLKLFCIFGTAFT